MRGSEGSRDRKGGGFKTEGVGKETESDRQAHTDVKMSAQLTRELTNRLKSQLVDNDNKRCRLSSCLTLSLSRTCIGGPVLSTQLDVRVAAIGIRHKRTTLRACSNHWVAQREALIYCMSGGKRRKRSKTVTVRHSWSPVTSHVRYSGWRKTTTTHKSTQSQRHPADGSDLVNNPNTCTNPPTHTHLIRCNHAPGKA